MKALIIGGGIGGLTTAIALQKTGIDCEVFEQAPELKEAGAGIWLGGNALNALEKIGAGTVIKQASNFLKDIRVKTYDGKTLQGIDGEMLREKYGNGTHAIHRATLQRLLAGHFGGKIHLAHKLLRVEQDDTSVTAFFENGEKATADILIGADGIRSVTREQCVVNARYRYSGQTCWRATIDIELSEAEKACGYEVWGKKPGLRASYSQVGDKQVYFWATQKSRAGQFLTGEQSLARIREILKDFTGHMQEVIRHIEPEKIIQSDLYDIQPIKKWYHRRVVLVGDAAHATTPNLGQGASQAIEDAVALAESLAENPDPVLAFQGYQDRRIRRATWIVNTSWQFGQLSNLGGPIGYGLKVLLTKLVPDSVSQRQFEKIYRAV